MFTTVAKNFFKFLAAYFCLLVAFALRKYLTTEFKKSSFKVFTLAIKLFLNNSISIYLF